MTVKEITDKLTTVFKEVLEHDNFELLNATTAKDVDGWDSVTHMMIIGEVESNFNIKFELMDLMNLNNVGDLIKMIASKIS